MSNENIFRKHAPLYYAAGINVIPLRAKSKRPLINAWSDYSDFPIPVEVQNAWLAMPENHNIGVVLGKQSNLGMLDIDYADDALIKEIRKIFLIEIFSLNQKDFYISHKSKCQFRNRIHILWLRFLFHNLTNLKPLN